MLENLKPGKQREALRTFAKLLTEIADNSDNDDVDLAVTYVEAGFLAPLGSMDFFGTDGWQHWLGLE